MHGLNRTWTSTKQTRPLRRRSGRCGSPATGLVLAPFCNRGWRFQMQLSTVADLASAVADEHGSSSEPVELPTARARSCSDLLLHGGEHVQHLQCLRVYTCAPTWLAACFVDTPRCHWNRIRSTGHCVRERNERKGKRTVERACYLDESRVTLVIFWCGNLQATTCTGELRTTVANLGRLDGGGLESASPTGKQRFSTQDSTYNSLLFGPGFSSMSPLSTRRQSIPVRGTTQRTPTMLRRLLPQ